MKLAYIFISVNLLTLVNCLNLKNHGVWGNFYTSSIAVYRNRAFLALPRSSCYNNLTDPTLLETHWNGDHQTLTAGRKLYFPSEKYQNWGKCDQLQDVISLDIELKNRRLWVLDKGSKRCSPKIIVYNLHTNSEIYTWKLEQGEDLSFLVVDVLGLFGPVAYVGNRVNNKLIVVSFNERAWRDVELSSKGFEIVVPERLSISQMEPILYLTSDNSTELFSLNLTEIRNLNLIKLKMVVPNIQAKFVGHKLGPSAGMVADVGGGLNYYLTRDFAVLRWITRKPLQAEFHDVLVQSYEILPYVSHLFNDPYNNVWALVNPLRPQECKNLAERKLLQLPEEIPVLQSRIVKLIKFTKKGRRGKFLPRKQ